MAFGNLISRPSSGARYDDQNANKDAYRNAVGGVKQEAACGTVGHLSQKFECILIVF
jgi:hypothetical protein